MAKRPSIKDTIEATRQYMLLRLRRPELFRKATRAGHMKAADFYTAREFRQAMIVSFGKFHHYQGRYPNLVHPKSFSDKVIWRKFFAELPLPQAGNKVMTDFFISKDCPDLEVVPVIWHSTEPVLPANDALEPGWYYLKANHAFDMSIAIRYPLSSQDRAEAEALSAKWLKVERGRADGQWFYDAFPKEILLEPSLSEGEAAISWCYVVLEGRIGYLALVRKVDGKQQVLRLDENLQPLDHQPKKGRITDFDDFGMADKLRDYALKVAKPFPLSRVDLYVTKSGKIYLGEMTFVPGNGSTVLPREFDLAMGAMVKSIG